MGVPNMLVPAVVGAPTDSAYAIHANEAADCEPYDPVCNIKKTAKCILKKAVGKCTTEYFKRNCAKTCASPPPPPSAPPPAIPEGGIQVISGMTGAQVMCVEPGDETLNKYDGKEIVPSCCTPDTHECLRYYLGNNGNNHYHAATCIAGSVDTPPSFTTIAHTYAEAVNTCASHGLVLCDARAEDQACRDRGCSYNLLALWTNLQCTGAKM